MSSALALTMLSNEVLTMGVYGFSAFAKSPEPQAIINKEEKKKILGDAIYSGNIAAFPKAKYDKDVAGFEIKVGTQVRYILNNQEYESKDGVIRSVDKLSSKEFTNLLRSIEVILSEKEGVDIEIRVGEEVDDFKYYDGNYYKVIKCEKVSKEEYEKISESVGAYGKKGNPLKIQTDEELEFIANIAGGEKVQLVVPGHGNGDKEYLSREKLESALSVKWVEDDMQSEETDSVLESDKDTYEDVELGLLIIKVEKEEGILGDIIESASIAIPQEKKENEKTGSIDTVNKNEKAININNEDKKNEEWVTGLSEMPTARYSLTTAVVDGKIYAIGGNSTGPLKTVEMYDPEKNKWETKADLLEGGYYSGSAVIDGKIYVIGGKSGPTSPGKTTLQVYDPQTDKWEYKASMKYGRYGLLCGVIDGKIYVIGDGSSSSEQHVEIYDPNTDTWEYGVKIPRSREGMKGGVVDGKIYVIGGNKVSSCSYVDEYDPASGEWQIKKEMTNPRIQFSVATIGDMLYCVGGRPDTGSPYGGKTLDAYIPGEAEIVVPKDEEAPKLQVPSDLSVFIKSRVNVLKGVSAIDNVDGDISDDVEAYYNNSLVTNLDTLTSGNKVIKYKVSDKAGNIAEKYRNITVKNPNIMEDVKLVRENLIVKGYFNKKADLDYYVYRKDNVTSEFIEIDKVEAGPSNVNGYFEDIKIKDSTNPVIEDYYLFRGKEGKNVVELNGEDYGEMHTYKIQGVDDIGGIAEELREASKYVPGSGIKGYVYIVDENTNTEVTSNKINSTDGIITLNKVADNAYIHVKAIDNEGNESDTIHIKLRDLSYNNKPRIYTALNKVLYVGDTFDPMEGVTAYDYEDGYITEDVRYWGHENVNTNKIGSYPVKYEVLDSKGLASRIETVTIHVAGTIDLKTAGGHDKVNLEWTPEKNASLYRVYRTGADDRNYTMLGEYVDTNTVDLTAIDIKSPVIEKMFEATPKNSTKQELVMEARDLASTYHYFVQAIDKNGDVINASHVRSGQSKADIEGYAYVIDKNSNTQAPTIINAKTIDEVIDAAKGNEKKILHVRAIDRNGNLGDTVHHLIGGKYETNFTPIISGVRNRAVLVGSKLNVLKDVTASDYEDGDLTKKIDVSTNLDLDNVGKYEVKYTVTDKDNNTREVTSYVRVVKYMDLTTTPDLKNNNMILDWEKEKITNIPVYYEIRKYNSEIDRYAVIGRTNDTNFVDVECKDIFGPKYYGSDKTILDNGELSVDINMKDRGPNNRYQVVARMRLDNTIVGTMTDLEDSDNEMYVVGSFAGGIEGYSWHLSNIREDVVDKTIEEYSNNITTGFKGFTWLHFAAIDVYGNKTDTVHIKLGEILGKNKPPVLDVSDKEILIGTKFDPLSIAKAYDEEDGDLTKYITVSGTVDVNTLGQYPLVYSVTDFSGNQVSKAITVTVVDIKPFPSNPDNDYIEVNCDSEVTIIVGTPYDPMQNVRVKSTKDGDITHKVTYTTNLNVNVIGDYIVNYFAQDSIGNSVRFKRIVHVVPKGTPVSNYITIDKVNVPWFVINSPIYVRLGNDINPRRGVRAFDKEDGELTSEIKVYGVVNTLIPGRHTVCYRVTDSDGHTSYATRSVYVYRIPHINPDGNKPPKDDDDDIDKGENGGGLPNKPGQPIQPGVGGEKPGGTGGKPDFENDEHDIYEEIGIQKEEEDPSIVPPVLPSVLPKDDPSDDPGSKPKDDPSDDPSSKPKDDPSDDPDINIDTDGDDIPDINIDIDGDGIPDINIDIDGDDKADEKIEPNYKDKIKINSEENWSKKWGIKSHAPKGASLLDKILYYPIEFNLNGKVVYDIPKARKVSLKKVLTEKENSKSNYNYIYTSDKSKSSETLKDITFKGNNFYFETESTTIEFNVKEEYILDDIKEQVEQLKARGINKFTVEEAKGSIKVNRNKKHVPLDIETVHVVKNPYINTVISPNLNDGLVKESITISSAFKNIGSVRPSTSRRAVNAITVDTAEIKLGKYQVNSTISLGNTKVFESERTIAILSIRMILIILLLIGLLMLIISYISSKRKKEKEEKEIDENIESIEL